MSCIKGFAPGNLNESDRAHRFQNPAGYTGLKGLSPKKEGGALVGTGMKTVPHINPAPKVS